MMTINSEKEFLTALELAKRWRVDEHTVMRWRKQGKRPVFYRINGKILYKVADIEELELAKRQSI